MRLRAVYLLAAVASVAAVLVVAGPANATANWSCGEDFAVSPGTLDNNLDCSGYNDNALVITAAGVTLNFGGHTVTVDGSDDNDGVYNDGYAGLTVENGTINMDTGGTAVEGYGIANDNGAGLTVADMTINGGYYGVDSYGDNPVGLTVDGSTIAGSTSDGVYTDGQGSTITNNTISPSDYYYAHDECERFTDGILASYGLGDVITGNTITGNYVDGNDAIEYCFLGETGIHLHYDTGAWVSNNTVTSMGHYGFYSSGSAGTSLNGNTFSDNYNGVRINDGTAAENNDAISNNYILHSYHLGVRDYKSDMNTYTGNTLTDNGYGCSSDTEYCGGFFIDPDEVGSVTMTNNYARLGPNGYTIWYAYNGDSYASTPSLISGNSATYNDYGFYDYYSTLATWSDNTAYGNNYDGFDFYYPVHETITGNLATHNGSGSGDGFYFDDNYAPYNPLAVTNNTATYNGDYGFDADYPLSASSGNVGNSTNGTDDCWYISGCS